MRAMTWTSFKVTSAQLAQGDGVLKKFTAEWTPIGAPHDMALGFLQEPFSA
jgi:hypothetical protein